MRTNKLYIAFYMALSFVLGWFWAWLSSQFKIPSICTGMIFFVVAFFVLFRGALFFVSGRIDQ